MIPNLFVIGAQKCSTTSTYRFLVNQRDVAGPKLKEPNYLSFDGGKGDLRWRVSNTLYRHNRVRTLNAYLALYAGLPADARWIVDGSASYLYAREAAAAIRALSPDARLLVLLRNPVDRAFSEFMMQVAIGVEQRSFRQAIEAEARKGHAQLKRRDRRYVWHGLYDLHLAPYLALFDRSAIHIDCVDRPGETLGDVLGRIARFLDLGDDLLSLGRRENVGTQARYPRLNRLLYKSGAKALLARATSPSLKTRAKHLYYRPIAATLLPADRARLWSAGWFDVERVEALSGLRLDHWRQDRDRCTGGGATDPRT